MSFEEQVRDALAARADTTPDDPDLATRVLVRARRARRRSWLVRALIALVSILVAVVLVTTNAFGKAGLTGPDPRATGVPVRTATPSLPTATTGTASASAGTYRTVDGPPPTVTGTGAPIAVVPRVELRTSGSWFVTAGFSVALPTSVREARTIIPAGTGWVMLTMSDAFTGGDSDPGAQMLAISSTGSIRSLVTGDVRSVAVSPDATQVASVETTDRPWTVRLQVRRISNGALLRTVSIPLGQSGMWPYPALLWNSAGIIAANQSRSITEARASILVVEDTVTDVAPVTGIFQRQGESDVYATVAHTGLTCIGGLVLPTQDPGLMACGAFGNVTALGKGMLLATLPDSNGKQAALVDIGKATVTQVTLPDAIAKTYLNEVFAETGTTVLVPDFETKTWWRWDVVRNVAEQAPLPAGASAVISW